jgi:hypothetical protein
MDLLDEGIILQPPYLSHGEILGAADLAFCWQVRLQTSPRGEFDPFFRNVRLIVTLSKMLASDVELGKLKILSLGSVLRRVVHWQLIKLLPHVVTASPYCGAELLDQIGDTLRQILFHHLPLHTIRTLYHPSAWIGRAKCLPHT